MGKKITLLCFIVNIFFASQANAYEWGSENAALPPAPNGKSWSLNQTYTDEFNSWDSSKWQAKHDWWDGSNSGRPGAFVEGNNAWDTPNVEIKNSKLMLYARANGPSAEKWVGTSVVSSRTRLSYGYYEVKMKASKLATTSSFWMQGRYSEIDVIEAIGAPKKGAEILEKTVHSNFHYFPNGFGKPGYQQEPLNNNKIDNGSNPDGAAHGWHTYGIWWRNNREAYIYLDGKRIGDFHHYSEPGVYKDKISFPANFNENMVMFFDTEVWNWGNGRPGTPTRAELNATDGSNAMQIEWVRAYKLVDGPSNPSPNSGAPIGKTISIHTLDDNNGGYLWADPNTLVARANSNTEGSWGLFVVERGVASKPGTVAFRHQVSGKYLKCACGNGGSGKLNIGADRIGTWESFVWNELGNDRFSLTAYNERVVYTPLDSNDKEPQAFSWSTNASDYWSTFIYKEK